MSFFNFNSVIHSFIHSIACIVSSMRTPSGALLSLSRCSWPPVAIRAIGRRNKHGERSQDPGARDECGRDTRRLFGAAGLAAATRCSSSHTGSEEKEEELLSTAIGILLAQQCTPWYSLRTMLHLQHCGPSSTSAHPLPLSRVAVHPVPTCAAAVWSECVLLSG